MAEFIEPGPICDTAGIREAVCIHTRKIFDSCRDKDIALLKHKKPCSASTFFQERGWEFTPSLFLRL